MAFKKGQTGNEKGRPVKVINSPEALRNEIHSFLASQLRTVKKDWKVLSPRDRVTMFERLARYVLPGPEFDLNKLSEKDLDILITRIKHKLDGNEG